MTPRQHAHALLDSVMDFDAEIELHKNRVAALEDEIARLRAERASGPQPVASTQPAPKPSSAPPVEGCSCQGEWTCAVCKHIVLMDERDDARALAKTWRKRMKQLARAFGEAGAAHSIRAEKEAADAMLRARDMVNETIQQVTEEHAHVPVDAGRETRSAWEHEPKECCVEAIRKDRTAVVKFIQANAEQVGKAYGPNGAHLQSLLDQLSKALAPKGAA